MPLPSPQVLQMRQQAMTAPKTSGGGLLTDEEVQRIVQEEMQAAGIDPRKQAEDALRAQIRQQLAKQRGGAKPMGNAQGSNPMQPGQPPRMQAQSPQPLNAGRTVPPRPGIPTPRPNAGLDDFMAKFGGMNGTPSPRIPSGTFNNK
jgi:hypothetical protein